MLDEADRLLDMGFKVQLDAIMQRLPRQRRTGEHGSQVHNPWQQRGEHFMIIIGCVRL